MSLQPINKEHVGQVAQLLLTYLDDERNSTPNNMLEGIVSAKSLMRSLVQGNLVICQNVPDQKVTGEGEMPPELKAAIDAEKAAADDEKAPPEVTDQVDNSADDSADDSDIEPTGEIVDEEEAA